MGGASILSSNFSSLITDPEDLQQAWLILFLDFNNVITLQEAVLNTAISGSRQRSPAGRKATVDWRPANRRRRPVREALDSFVE